MCQWPNGDVSFAQGRTKLEACELLDETDAAEESMLTEVKSDFMVHFKPRKLVRSAPMDGEDLYVVWGDDGMGEDTQEMMPEKAVLKLVRAGKRILPIEVDKEVH